jgi:hypothetical protein
MQRSICFFHDFAGEPLTEFQPTLELPDHLPSLSSKNDLPKTTDFVLGLDVFLSIVCYFRAFGHSVHVLQERPQAFRRLYG